MSFFSLILVPTDLVYMLPLTFFVDNVYMLFFAILMQSLMHCLSSNSSLALVFLACCFCLYFVAVILTSLLMMAHTCICLTTMICSFFPSLLKVLGFLINQWVFRLVQPDEARKSHEGFSDAASSIVVGNTKSSSHTSDASTLESIFCKPIQSRRLLVGPIL